MSLESYARNRWLREHESSAQEITNLLSLADRDIEQSQTPGLGPEWQLDIAYNFRASVCHGGFGRSRIQSGAG